jgi:eukaryotic-like serine/threonine-protein kinase
MENMKTRDIAFEDLKKIISERTKPIVFWTGAGVSTPTIPSWRGLLAELLKDAKVKAKNIVDSKSLQASIEFAESEKDLWLAFERLSSGVGSETFRSVIKRVLSPSNSADIPLVQSLLWELRPKGIVTLNLDLFTLRSSASYSKAHGVPIQILPGQFGQNISVFKETRPFIAYPHGNFDNVDTWTFTSSSLSSRLSDNQYVSWVNALFASHVVVFVGLTADDVAVGGLLDRISKANGVEFSDNFWITSRSDSETDHWAETRGIRVIRYEAVGDNHDDLAKLLKEIKEFKAVENSELEMPLYSAASAKSIFNLANPEDINLHDKEGLRKMLNSHAQHLFFEYKDDESKRDELFRGFLTKYEDAVHNAYSISTASGKNKFLGYDLVKRANGGAFGSVFQAYDQEANAVAIKILHAEKLGDIGFYRNFRRGVNSLKILSEHEVSGIVRFIDAVEIPPVLVMEWIEGATLADIVHQGGLSTWREKLIVMKRLADILRESHALPERVLHRDLRPANVMLRDFHTNPEKLDLVVLDFDLSWHRGAEDHSIMYSPALGYLAPEQRRRIPKATTRTSLVDSYGFGMVMFFVMTGRDPIPDAHLIPSWRDELESGITINFCRDWHCIPRRIARLILGAVKEDQNSRLEMSQIQSELQSLLDYIDSPKVLSSVSVLTEELAMRTEHMQGYTWEEQSSKAVFQATPERCIELQADVSASIIVVNIKWQNAGTQDWGQISRLLEKGYPKLLESLKYSGWDVVHSKASRSFVVTGKIYAVSVADNLENVAKELDKAIGYAFSMAGHT